MFITITQPTPQVSAITAVLEKAIAAVDSSTGGTKKYLRKALKELNEDPVDPADSLKDMKKARKKLNGKAGKAAKAKEFKCPNEACDLIDEAIELLEKVLTPF